jgi:hypothetical protein
MTVAASRQLAQHHLQVNQTPTTFAMQWMLLAAFAFALPTIVAAEEPASGKFTIETLRGRVVFAGEALARLHNIKVVDEAREHTLALETPEGKLYPLVEDTRGRAFRLDRRLMGVPLELVVRQHEGSPIVQVIRVYSIEKDERRIVDYWCDICSIPMYELKACECCQGEIRLRMRKVNDQGEPLE